MKMDEMTNRFVKAGFDVDRTYDSRTNTYTFTITRDGLSYAESFDYRPGENPVFRDTRQKMFIDHMLDQFRLTCLPRPWSVQFEEYAKNDIEMTKQLLNNTYGISSRSDRYPLIVPRGWDILEIEDVIFNEPATIVFWADGTKTVVKCQDGDTYDAEKGLAMAIAKKALGNKGNYCNVFHKWMNKYVEKRVLPKFAASVLADAMSKLGKALCGKTKDSLVQQAYVKLTKDLDIDAAVGYLGEYLDD